MEKSADRLGWLLKELRLGTTEIARRLNSHPNNVSNKLRRENVTGEFVLEVWRMLKADDVNINIHWVLTGEGHPFSDWVNPEF